MSNWFKNRRQRDRAAESKERENQENDDKLGRSIWGDQTVDPHRHPKVVAAIAPGSNGQLNTGAIQHHIVMATANRNHQQSPVRPLANQQQQMKQPTNEDVYSEEELAQGQQQVIKEEEPQSPFYQAYTKTYSPGESKSKPQPATVITPVMPNMTSVISNTVPNHTSVSQVPPPVSPVESVSMASAYDVLGNM